jgi:hypothetical protein
MSRQVHILEGHSSGHDWAYTACGRSLNARSAAVVGRAWVLDGTRASEVTCAQCKSKYRVSESGGGGT